MHIHSNIIILRFMHVHGRRYIVNTLLFIQDCSFTNEYAYFWAVSGKKLYRIRIQIPLLTKKILSRSKREQEPYFLKKTTAEWRMVRYGRYLCFLKSGLENSDQDKASKNFLHPIEPWLSFYSTMIFYMKSIFADNRGHSCLCKDRQDLRRQYVCAMQGQKDRSLSKARWLGP